MDNIERITTILGQAQAELDMVEDWDSVVTPEVNRLHVLPDVFVKLFVPEVMEVQEHYAAYDKYRVYATMNNTEVFAICSRKEYAEIFPDRKTELELENDRLIAELDRLRGL